MADLQKLRNAVAEALADKPSEQPVHTNANIKTIADGESRMDAKKTRGSVAAGYKARQKGNPNRSYSVAAVQMAKARMG